MIDITCISDTHTMHDQVRLAPTDLLLHAGDMTGLGEVPELTAFADWFAAQDAEAKVCIAGNHDFFCEEQPILAKELFESRGIVYLHDELYTYRKGDNKLTIYGSPYQPRFGNWAFNMTAKELKHKWSTIPDDRDIDIIMTHGPAYDSHDRTALGDCRRAGCKHLRNRINELRPKLHVFGHIHEAYGTSWNPDNDVWSCNASIATLQYKPTNAPSCFVYNGEELIEV